jgi:hypothetical protein
LHVTIVPSGRGNVGGRGFESHPVHYGISHKEFSTTKKVRNKILIETPNSHSSSSPYSSNTSSVSWQLM